MSLAGYHILGSLCSSFLLIVAAEGEDCYIVLCCYNVAIVALVSFQHKSGNGNSAADFYVMDCQRSHHWAEVGGHAGRL